MLAPKKRLEGHPAKTRNKNFAVRPVTMVVLLALLVAAAAVVFRQLTLRPRGTGVIKVGVVLPLTGPLAFFGEPERAVLSQSTEALDRAGSGGEGASRRPRVQLLIEDSAGSARDGVSATQKVLLQEPAAVITSLTVVSNATQPLLSEQKTPQIALSVHPTLAGQSRYTFRPYYGFEQEMRVLADYLIANNRRRVGVLWVLVPECEAAINDVLGPRLEESGGQVVASESYNFTDMNLRAQVAKIASSEPDAILVMDFGNLYGLILKEAENLGVRKLVIGNIGLLTAPQIDDALLEGVVFSGPSFVINNSPEYAKFAAEFEQRTKMKPTYDVLYTKDAFDLLVKALRETADADGRVDRDRLAERLRGMDAYKGVTGEMKINRNGNVEVGIGMGVYHDGKIQPLP
jgi:branched-chain amino acid transport system substrate-binding protein